MTDLNMAADAAPPDGTLCGLRESLTRCKQRRAADMRTIKVLAATYAEDAARVRRMVMDTAKRGDIKRLMADVDAVLSAWEARMQALDRLATHYISEAGHGAILGVTQD